MFEISVKSHFSGAHHLVGYDGACLNVHGHNWEVEVVLRGRKTDEIGMLVDFKKVKSAVNDVLNKLDHHDLNALSIFTHQNPTSENLARYLYTELSSMLNSSQRHVRRVWVSESPGKSACYWESGGQREMADGCDK